MIVRKIPQKEASGENGKCNNIKDGGLLLLWKKCFFART